MSDQIIQRAAILLRQRKFREAESILSGLFAEDPSNTQVMHLMCEVKIHQEKFDQALELANSAIGLDPADAHLFYQRARIYLHKERLDQAESDLVQAIALNPYDADYFSALSVLKAHRKQFQVALEMADKAVELDAENIHALNARSTALLKLNRKEESFNTIEGALREDPDNAYTHSNYGWGLLEKGSHKQALKHFSEALRKDPNLHMARVGMAEALKARYFIYRVFMKYSFWMGNLSSKYQWSMIIGLYLAFRIVKSIATNNPSLEPWLTPVLILFSLFAFSTWIIGPVGNLFLRLNRYGRHLLSREQLLSANFVAASAGLALASVITWLLTGIDAWLVLAGVSFTMMIPFSVMLSARKKKGLLIAYSSGLALIGLIAFLVALSGDEPMNGFVMIYLFGFFVFQWVANFLIIKEDNR